jgi:CO/xanthine dehydrogenase FAD-binding subunit
MVRFERPQSLEEALGLLQNQQWQVLAGGTDIYPAIGSKLHEYDVLDISRLSEIKGITLNKKGCRIGALTTWREIWQAQLPPAFYALQQAAREVGSIQIQNSATIAGNLCNASPAADGVPPLMVLDAQIELTSLNGTRHLPISEFILGNRQTALNEGEIVSAIIIPNQSLLGKSHFSKLGARRYLVISIAMVAVRLIMNDNRIRGLAVSVGSCSVVARRLKALELALVGKSLSELDELAWGDDFFVDISPIDDVRATKKYRKDAIKPLIIRAIRAAAQEESKL